METNNIQPRKQNNGKMMAGIIILFIGALLLFRQYDYFMMPHWLFSWPMFMIGFGLYMCSKYNFRKPFWLLVTGMGVVFLVAHNLHQGYFLIGPMWIIGIGAWMIMKHNKPAGTTYKEENYTEV